MQRYFAKAKTDDTIVLYETDHHHIKNVMRNTVGDKIEVVYDSKLYICEITSLSPLSLKIVETHNENRDLNAELTIAVSLVNEQKMDLILQKLTELGVTNIIPLKTERSIVKLDEKKMEKKLLRWTTICKEASEQSKRTTIPKISKITTIKELINIKKELKLICSLSELSKPLSNYLKKDIKEILFVIGPEGGFTKEEESYLLANKFDPVSLGKRVMRVETATMYVASIINYIYEG